MNNSSEVYLFWTDDRFDLFWPSNTDEHLYWESGSKDSWDWILYPSHKDMKESNICLSPNNEFINTWASLEEVSQEYLDILDQVLEK